MHELLLIAIPTLPLIMVMISLYKRSWLAITLAPLLALVSALSIPVDTTVSIPWLLLGVHWQLDATAQLFLTFSALVWLVAAWYVSAQRDKPVDSVIYHCLFLIAMMGNFLLIVAADMLSFYLGFAMMGLSAYALIVKPSQQARRAARVYLGFTLVGELALFTALLLIVSSSGSVLFNDLAPANVSDLAMALLVLGFGIKLALPGLHFWLPLSYSAAPLISAAVLSGPMMKAGLLGWIRFVPTGTDSLTGWGELLMILGGSGLLLGTLLALLQLKPSAVLAYSSVAKMGIISTLFGYALANPQQAEPVIAALLLFAMHHLLVKSALFLGLQQYRQSQGSSAVFAGLVILALSLVGLPLSGGSAAKLELAAATRDELNLLLLFSGFATTLMMLHFLQRVRQSMALATAQTEATSIGINPQLAWWLLLPIAWWAPFIPTSIAFDGKSLLLIAAGLLIYLLIRRDQKQLRQLPFFCRPGDFYHLLSRIRLVNPLRYRSARSLLPAILLPEQQQSTRDQAGEQALTTPGLWWLVVTALLVAALLIPIF